MEISKEVVVQAVASPLAGTRQLSQQEPAAMPLVTQESSFGRDELLTPAIAPRVAIKPCQKRVMKVLDPTTAHAAADSVSVSANKKGKGKVRGFDFSLNFITYPTN